MVDDLIQGVVPGDLPEIRLSFRADSLQWIGQPLADILPDAIVSYCALAAELAPRDRVIRIAHDAQSGGFLLDQDAATVIAVPGAVGAKEVLLHACLLQ